MNPRARASGFTLIELLVALVIFGIFAVLAYAGLGRLLDNRGRLIEEAGLAGSVAGFPAHLRRRGPCALARGARREA